MKKLFAVEISVTALVWADDEIDAYKITDSQAGDIIGDNPLDIFVMNEITTLGEAESHGYPAGCYVYAHKEERKVEELIEEIQCRPVPDTKTLPLSL